MDPDAIIARQNQKLLNARQGPQRDYYNRLIEILENPNAGMTPIEQGQYMAGVRRTGQDVLQSQGSAYDRWAASRNISGGPEGETRIKLAQELIRNMTSARTNMNDLNFRARTQARMQALGLLGQNVEHGRDLSMQQYMTELQDQYARENMWSQLLGLGIYGAAQYAFPGYGGAVIGAAGNNMIGPSGIPGYNPQVVSNPRGIY